MIVCSYPTPWGDVTLESDHDWIVHVYLPGRKIPSDKIWQEDALLHRAGSQLAEYLAGERTSFDLPILLDGTPFMKSVWQVLLQIPYGETVTYREIARRLEKPRAYRAVGMANGRNPAGIFVPCHRVVGSDGSLTGFGGGLEMKKGLLTLEREGANQ